MNITRFQKAIFLVFMMLVTGTAFWLFNDDRDVHNIISICGFAIMVAGSVLILYEMERSLKDSLAMASMVLGIYLFVMFSPNLLSDISISFIISMALMMAGGAVFVFGINLWCGSDYNIVRIRVYSLAVMAGSGVQIYFMYVFRHGYVSWLEQSWEMWVIFLLALSFLLVAMDSSLGFVGTMRSIRHSLKAITRRMDVVGDAYILEEDAKQIEAIVSEKKGSVETVLRSNDYGNRPMSVTAEDGKVRLGISSEHHVYADPVILMDVESFVRTDAYLRMFSPEGRRIRIMVFDYVQEDMSKPLLFGREFDTKDLIAWGKKKVKDRVNKNKGE
ncbi:hypothetical protein TALC_00934 [Thermoplasmatales archaeon BRNA1]|nr:hypothetical protein TALC_00934 [Thermoplasmatales archaeon BRNA1]